MADIQPLLIFDSGVGGFSILKHLLHKSFPIVYFADQKFFPYGDKDVEWVRHRLSTLSKEFSRFDPKAVVLACNTGTVSAIDDIRKLLSCPVFGVEPVTKMLSKYSLPVVWATKVTSESIKAKMLRESHAKQVQYYTPSGLANAIEDMDEVLIDNILKQAKQELGNVSAIGLSCTHYPLIESKIRQTFPKSVVLDPSIYVVRHILNTLNLSASQRVAHNSTIQYHTTGTMLKLDNQIKHYMYEHRTVPQK
ncbi:MAG: hypothetical protein E6R05_02985 [Candidatus Moraniibacteriota bacterium]|nr:MAG: hypothetical protein E6R05_02985 [Candidatus Moranbacteria bacterium]